MIAAELDYNYFLDRYTSNPNDEKFHDEQIFQRVEDQSLDREITKADRDKKTKYAPQRKAIGPSNLYKPVTRNWQGHLEHDTKYATRRLHPRRSFEARRWLRLLQ
ncbi:hypothetical protein ACHAP7_000991 [Fusarium lateritium]